MASPLSTGSAQRLLLLKNLHISWEKCKLNFQADSVNQNDKMPLSLWAAENLFV